MRRFRGSRGATGAEYAVVLSLLVVASIGTINFLSDRASDETRNQADCVAQRPPVDDCQLPPLIPTTTTTAAPPPGPPGPPAPPGPPDPPDPCDTDPSPAVCFEPPPPPPLPPPPQPNESEWQGPPGSAVVDGDWVVTPGITVTDVNGEPVEGARVVFKIDIHNPSLSPEFFTQYAECITDASGQCTVDYVVPYSNATTVNVSVYDIFSTPATNPPDEMWENVSKP